MALNLASLIKKFNPEPEKAGKILLMLNAAGMVFAAASNTVAAAKDKNTSAEDKKFLVPAGAVTGVANIGLYYLFTDKVIKGLENGAENYIKNMNKEKLSDKALEYANNSIKKASKSLFKKSDEYISSMKATLIDNGGKATQKAKEIFAHDLKGGAGVLGAFIGAVVGCSVLTPIIRDVSAYFVQKKMEKNNPELQTKQYRPYFDPIHIRKNAKHKYQPLSMKSYMAFTNKGMKV